MSLNGQGGPNACFSPQRVHKDVGNVSFNAEENVGNVPTSEYSNTYICGRWCALWSSCGKKWAISVRKAYFVHAQDKVGNVFFMRRRRQCALCVSGGEAMCFYVQRRRKKCAHLCEGGKGGNVWVRRYNVWVRRKCVDKEVICG